MILTSWDIQVNTLEQRQIQGECHLVAGFFFGKLTWNNNSSVGRWVISEGDLRRHGVPWSVKLGGAGGGAAPRVVFFTLSCAWKQTAGYPKNDGFGKGVSVKIWWFSGWWFKICFLCSPLFGEKIQFDYYFSDGLVQPPTSFGYLC